MRRFMLVPFIAVAALFANNTPKDIADQDFKSSESRMETAIKKFNSDDYKKFLANLDDAYQKARSSWDYDDLLEQRKEVARLPKEAFNVSDKTVQEGDEKLLKIRNNALIEACLAMPSYPESASIRHMIFFSPSTAQKTALNYLYSLKQKFHGDGKTPLENVLINLDMEYWLKSLSLETEGLKSKMDPELLKERHLALDLERVEKMKDAALADPNTDEAKQIMEAYVVFPKHKEVLVEEDHLYRLAKGHVLPQNPLEEKAKEIMTAYLDSKDKLVRDHFQGKSNS
ncbi:MAG: hypothetical protein SP1CHLAM54_13460 [Chlamydiia bacterium]|nr:hypothetical protein [Chlamydiia bacterium]MCH9616239.1 hypothetical protein [Chlamydiia bacterium]MCH9629775.1 hypothetical protein [Chlamydiia bacterium]